MSTSRTDRIERQVFIKAPRTRVWRALTIERREAAYRGNSEGWTIQMGNIERYVSQSG
ncbi:MAG TPA: hypothetical protein VHB68_19580 [Steroidobacteraceae bacterium]|nr:hypothetical protein [Steroidobacteraceae bacterium]